jgi:hypothetical protein
MRTETGDAIVDWLFCLAEDKTLPIEVREDARRKIAACALRQPEETVEDVVGPRH